MTNDHVWPSPCYSRAAADMRLFSQWMIAVFASPAGVVVLAALDSTIFFTLPFGIDAAVILLSARSGGFAWIVPVLATVGSIGGALISFWMGRKLGEKGLERFGSPRRLRRVQKRVRETGAIALAVLDLIPPPFPFTLFVLAAGALEVNASTFFITLAVCRLARFGGEAILAVVYGPQILGWLQSEIFNEIVGWIIVLALGASVISLVRLIRSVRPVSRQVTA
jgi:membrane protein YqaA with SNARE-associated domain